MLWLLVFGRELEPGACSSFPVFGGPAFSTLGGDEGGVSSPFSISLTRASEGDWPIFHVQEVIFGLPLSGVADVLEGVLALGEVRTSPKMVWLLGGGCGFPVFILLLLQASDGKGVSLSLFSFSFGGVLRAASAAAASFSRIPAFSSLRFDFSELLVEGPFFLDFGLPVEDPALPTSGPSVEDPFFTNFGLPVEDPVLATLGLPVEAPALVIFGLPVEDPFSVFRLPVEACFSMIFGLPVEAPFSNFGLPVEAFVSVFELPVEACFCFPINTGVTTFSCLAA